jgi:CubicO group peptidase (beta-lactamase class C family)
MNCKNLILCLLLPFICGRSFAQKVSVSGRLDSLFSTLAVQHQFSGSVLIAEKGKVVYKGARGIADEQSKTLNNVQTIFELASCSKQFIGVGIALLHRDGVLQYNDDITRYLPELSRFKGVTIYNLLHHTSGLPEFLADFRKEWHNKHIATNADLIAYYAAGQQPLDFEPNSRYQYCNTNYALLATIIERVSGRELGEFLSARIFKPLKMDRTFVYNRRLQPRLVQNYAYGYVWLKNSFEKVTEDDERNGSERMTYYMDGIVGAAKVNSTVEDLYKWMKAVQEHALLKPGEWEEVLALSTTRDGKKVSYGFGFELRKKEGKLLSYGHTGSWDGYTTLLFHDAQKDRTIIVLNNFDKGVCPYEEIKAILDDTVAVNPIPRKVHLPVSAIEKFAGVYKDPDHPATEHIISYLDGHLVYNTNEVQWDMRFFPVAGNVFRAIRQGGADGLLRFTRQADGSLTLEMLEYGSLVGKGILQ